MPFLALSCKEVCAFTTGLTQRCPPMPDAKLQVFNADHATTALISTQRLYLAQYRTAWARLFDGDTLNPSASTDLHRDASRPPQPAGAIAANVVAVTSLASTSLPGFAFASLNTDATARFPTQPVVVLNFALQRFYGDNITALHGARSARWLHWLRRESSTCSRRCCTDSGAQYPRSVLLRSQRLHEPRFLFSALFAETIQAPRPPIACNTPTRECTLPGPGRSS